MERNRRQYFRIDDEVLMRYRIVDKRGAHRTGSQLFDLEPELRALAHRQQQLMELLRERDSVMADYLGLLDEKIELVGRLLVTRTQDLKAEDRMRVSLSAGGISFFVSDSIDIGKLLDMQVVMLPGYESMQMVGVVRSCDPVSGGSQHRLAVEFTRIDDESRELIVRHCMQRDAENIRARHERA